MTAAVENLWGAVGLSPSEGVVLSRLIVTHGGTARSGELVGYPVRSTPALAKILAALESDGLVNRSRSTSDRRVVVVDAAASGHDLFGQVLERIEAEVSLPATDKLDADQIAVLTTLVSELTPTRY